MARIQILELPMVHVGDATETPFLLVIDQVETGPNGERLMNPSDLEGVCGRIGARHILIFEETIDIPANQVTLDDGQAMRLKVEPDLGDFSEKIETAIADANKRLVEQLRATKKQEAADG